MARPWWMVAFPTSISFDDLKGDVLGGLIPFDWKDTVKDNS